MWGVMPQPAAVSVAFVVDFVVYATLYLGAWVVVPAGRRNLAQFIVLVRGAIAKGPADFHLAVRSTGRNADITYAANRASIMALPG